MLKRILQKALPHAVAVVLFFLIATIYYMPVYQGKVLDQSDVNTFKGAAQEIKDFRKNTGQEALWTNSMFGGMPAYQISVQYNDNYVGKINWILMLGKAPASYLFLALIGFYVLLLAFGLSPWLAVTGAIAYGFSSYYFIILVPGHITKYIAMAYMAPVIAGIVYAFRKNLLAGLSIFGISLALQLHANHYQITYYTFIIILFYLLAEFIVSIQSKAIVSFIKKVAGVTLIAAIAFLCDFSKFYTTYEYSHYSTRGKSDLTSDMHNKTSGLDRDYATGWSYGKTETFNLLIPNLMGGSSSGELSKKSETYKFLADNNVPNAEQIVKNIPLYWGPQPSTSGPVYIGAIVIFLFFLGIFLVKSHLRWWLIGVTVLAIMLAWGRHLMWFSNLFFDFVPGYSKFRTVSMILVIVEFAMPLLGILAVKEIVDQKVSKESFIQAFKWSLGIVGGLCLFFLVFAGGLFDFSGDIDSRLIASGWPQQLIDLIRADRQSLLQADAFRSLVFILLAAGALALFYFKKLSEKPFIIILSLLILVDLWMVNRRFVNENNFVNKYDAEIPYQATNADLEILKDPDPNYRVLNTTVDVFNDASTSYYHKSIGGYHGAKMKRYQELIERQISKNNMAVLNMLNTKYIIVEGKDRQPIPQRNPGALGNAWFVDSLHIVANADAEIEALSNFDPAKVAICDKRFEKEFKNIPLIKDSASVIKLTHYQPNKLNYESRNHNDGLAVFSEIYYDKGWNAYIDGQLTPHFRVNYVLRAMYVPKGNHQIEFRFEPKSFSLGNKISAVSSSILILLLVLVAVIEINKASKQE